MNVLVTGASGFIGRNILLRFSRQWNILATWHQDETFTRFIRDFNLTTTRTVRVDLTSPADTRAKLSQGQYDLCLHCAANGDPARSVSDPAMDVLGNTMTLINTCQNNDIGRFIYFSSGAVYNGLKGPVHPESPLSPSLPYAINKLASEHYLRFFQSKGRLRHWIALRFFGAYGPFEAPRKIYNRLVRQFAFEKNPAFTVRGDGRNFIDAMHVDDTMTALEKLTTGTFWDHTVDLYSGHAVTVASLVERAARLFGITPKISFEGETPEYNQFHSKGDTMLLKYGFKPEITLEEGLLRFADFLKKNP